jgi:hypothetical protein
MAKKKNTATDKAATLTVHVEMPVSYYQNQSEVVVQIGDDPDSHIAVEVMKSEFVPDAISIDTDRIAELIAHDAFLAVCQLLEE